MNIPNSYFKNTNYLYLVRFIDRTPLPKSNTWFNSYYNQESIHIAKYAMTVAKTQTPLFSLFRNTTTQALFCTNYYALGTYFGICIEAI